MRQRAKESFSVCRLHLPAPAPRERLFGVYLVVGKDHKRKAFPFDVAKKTRLGND